MSALIMTQALPQINLLNPSLIPKREIFSGRAIFVWMVVALIAMAAVGWWAVTETRNVQRQASAQTALRSNNKVNSAGPDFVDAATVPTPQQIAALAQNLRTREALLESRRAVLAEQKRVLGSENGGPSGTLRVIAASIPDPVWVTELRATAGRLEIAGKSIDPAAVNVWLNRLIGDGYLAATPVPAVRVENANQAAATATPAVAATAPRVPVYSFSILATLARPFADDTAGRTP